MNHFVFVFVFVYVLVFVVVHMRICKVSMDEKKNERHSTRSSINSPGIRISGHKGGSRASSGFVFLIELIHRYLKDI